jgi:hypothetical protein
MFPKISATRFGIVLIAANLLFLIWFWWYFFAYSSTYKTKSVTWEQADPWAVVFNRGLGNSLSMPELKTVPIFLVASIVYLPCFLITWPIGRFLSPEIIILGTNPQGLRLIMVTILSFVQWAILLRIGTAIRRKVDLKRIV